MKLPSRLSGQHMIIKPVTTLARVFIAQPSSPCITVEIPPRWNDGTQDMKPEGHGCISKSFETISDHL